LDIFLSLYRIQTTKAPKISQIRRVRSCQPSNNGTKITATIIRNPNEQASKAKSIVLSSNSSCSVCHGLRSRLSRKGDLLVGRSNFLPNTVLFHNPVTPNIAIRVNKIPPMSGSRLNVCPVGMLIPFP